MSFVFSTLFLGTYKTFCLFTVLLFCSSSLSLEELTAGIGGGPLQVILSLMLSTQATLDLSTHQDMLQFAGNLIAGKSQGNAGSLHTPGHAAVTGNFITGTSSRTRLHWISTHQGMLQFAGNFTTGTSCSTRLHWISTHQGMLQFAGNFITGTSSSTRLHWISTHQGMLHFA